MSWKIKCKGAFERCRNVEDIGLGGETLHLFLGRTGHGKTTSIAYLEGRKLVIKIS